MKENSYILEFYMMGEAVCCKYLDYMELIYVNTRY